MSYAAYTKAQNVAESSRDIEYRLLAQVTASLLDAEEKDAAMNKIAGAVLWNRDVWAAFRLDLSHPDNGLPEGLKKQLIELSYWVDRETMDVLDQRSDLKTLIEVNRNIMEGLRPKTMAEREEAMQVPA